MRLAWRDILIHRFASAFGFTDDLVTMWMGPFAFFGLFQTVPQSSQR
jgi:hypothetical protein